MKRTFIAFAISISSTLTFAQVVRPDPVVDMTTAGFRSLRAKEEEPVASVYIHDEWVNGNIILKPDFEIKDIPIKYDLKNNLLEIQTRDGIKVASNAQLKSFQFDYKIEKYTYVDAANLGIKGFTGIVEELVTGKISLYAKPYVKRIPSNYNAALDVGTKTDTYVQQEVLFLILNNEAVDVTKSGKKILTYFDNKADAIADYAKKNNLSYKDKDDLISIVVEYNKLK